MGWGLPGVKCRLAPPHCIITPYLIWACIPYISHNLRNFCLNPANQFMECMPIKGKGVNEWMGCFNMVHQCKMGIAPPMYINPLPYMVMSCKRFPV